jgi:hypothetical protein
MHCRSLAKYVAQNPKNPVLFQKLRRCAKCPEAVESLMQLNSCQNHFEQHKATNRKEPKRMKMLSVKNRELTPLTQSRAKTHLRFLTKLTRPMKRPHYSSSLAILLTCGAMLCLVPVKSRADLTIFAQETPGGSYSSIGSLSWTISAANLNLETGTFTLDAAYRNLLSDANGLQFRFFQVIYYDDLPAKWNGVEMPTAHAEAHTETVVDTPAGGWDYMIADGGDDMSPFYESDTANNPVTKLPYAFPGLSYPALHSADGVNPGTISTSDNPNPTVHDPNTATLFETFLAYETPAMLAKKQVDLLGGFWWGVTTDAGGTRSGLDGGSIIGTDINAGTLNEMQDALDRSGFGAWKAISDLTIIPEPSTLALCLLAVVLFGLRQRR